MSQQRDATLHDAANRIREALQHGGPHAAQRAVKVCAEGFADAVARFGDLERRVTALEGAPAMMPTGLDFDQTVQGLQALARQHVVVLLGVTAEGPPTLMRVSGTLSLSVLGDGGRAYVGLEGTDLSIVLTADEFRSGSRSDADGSVVLVVGSVRIEVQQQAPEPAG